MLKKNDGQAVQKTQTVLELCMQGKLTQYSNNEKETREWPKDSDWSLETSERISPLAYLGTC